MQLSEKDNERIEYIMENTGLTNRQIISTAVLMMKRMVETAMNCGINSDDTIMEQYEKLKEYFMRRRG